MKQARIWSGMVGGAVVLLVATSISAAVGAEPGDRYVALGDSYSADSGVMPLTPRTHPMCAQSARNYPKQVAAALGLSLQDATCGGANVGHMTASQYPGVPPQFSALNGTESIVTLGIGGNDNNVFARTIAVCGAFAAVALIDKGAPCKKAHGSKFDDLIEADAPNIAAAIQGIHELSPDADVYVVNYPVIAPQSGRCYAKLPLTTQDTAYVLGIQNHVNTMLAEQAAANDATLIDVASASVGHDICKPYGVRWVEPPVSGQPIHPGIVGATGQAQIVAAALD